MANTEVYAGLGELYCERTATECDTLIAFLTCAIFDHLNGASSA
jgi:hypothetical protein